MNSHPRLSTVASFYFATKLLDRVRDRVQQLGYAKRTETSYVHWIKRYILCHGKRHPREMGKAEVEAFLTNLAVERHVAVATQPARNKRSALRHYPRQ